MNNFLQLGIDALQISHSPFRIFANILLAACLSWAIIKLYLKHYRGYGQPYQMCLSLMICSVVTCAIIMIIGANIALSLGLVGALSIIRFRTPIKDSRDLSYIFWAICIGLGSGAGAYLIILILMLVLGVVILYIEGNPQWAIRYADYLLVVTVDSQLSNQINLLSYLPDGAKLKSVTSSENASEMTYSLPEVKEGVEALLIKLREINGIQNTHIVSPDYEVLG